MDLSTTYLGLALPHPVLAGASPLSDTLEGIGRLEEAGAAAVVLSSLFEEQIEGRPVHRKPYARLDPAEVKPADYFSIHEELPFGPVEYLEHIRRAKAATGIPIIASLNGTAPGNWAGFARQIQEAGADALEANVYYTVTDLFQTGQNVEQRIIEIVQQLKQTTSLPVALKLTPFFSSLPNLARQLDDHGIEGLVLFNRFYLPDIDLMRLESVPRLRLSDSSELPLSLMWLAVLSGRLGASLAACGGVHQSEDVIKTVMAGADAVQMVSALLRHGVEHLTVVRDGIAQWLLRRQFQSLREIHGCLSLLRSAADPQAFQRGLYAATLQKWEP